MPAFTYTGDAGRYYPDLGRSFEPGEDVDLYEAPDDGRFEPTAPAIEPAAPAKES